MAVCAGVGTVNSHVGYGRAGIATTLDQHGKLCAVKRRGAACTVIHTAWLLQAEGCFTLVAPSCGELQLARPRFVTKGGKVHLSRPQAGY